MNFVSKCRLHQAYCIRSSRKATAIEAAVVKLVSRGFACMEKDKWTLGLRYHIHAIRSEEVKSTVQSFNLCRERHDLLLLSGNSLNLRHSLRHPL